jgi:hypothetical protein
MVANVLWYGVVRDYEAISYQFTLAFFTSHKHPQTSETCMHYTMCYLLAILPYPSDSLLSVIILSMRDGFEGSFAIFGCGIAGANCKCA